MAQFLRRNQEQTVVTGLTHDPCDKAAAAAGEDDIFDIVLLNALPQGVQGAVNVLADRRREGQLIALLLGKVSKMRREPMLIFCWNKRWSFFQPVRPTPPDVMSSSITALSAKLNFPFSTL